MTVEAGIDRIWGGQLAANSSPLPVSTLWIELQTIKQFEDQTLRMHGFRIELKKRSKT